MVRVTDGRFKHCKICLAAMPEGALPPGWTYTVIDKPGQAQLITPHEPGCPYGFKKVYGPEPGDE